MTSGTNSSLREVPRHRGQFVIGGTVQMQRDPLNFVMDGYAKYGDVFRTRVLATDWYFVRDPEIVNAINVTNAFTFYKPKLAKQMWKPFIGNGLVANDGEDWKRQHKLIMPAFHKQRIDSYGAIMQSYTQQLLKKWRPSEKRDFRVDMTELTLAIVAKTLFDVDIQGDSAVIGRAMADVTEALVEHIYRPLPLPKWWPSATNQRKHRAIGELEHIIEKLVQDRKNHLQDRGDLLSYMVFAADEQGQMSKVQLRDEMMTLIFAGHETTAHALTWAWYLLSINPDKTQKLVAELDAVLQGRPISVPDLPNLPYLEATVKEAMRLIPSVWAYMREPQEDIVIKDYMFPKGCAVFISPYALGRSAKIHPDAESFTPERWTQEYERALPKGAYVPFAAGARVCLGKPFAMMEMRIVLATLLQQAIPNIPDGYVPEMVPQLSLQPGEAGMPTYVRFRN